VNPSKFFVNRNLLAPLEGVNEPMDTLAPYFLITVVEPQRVALPNLQD
jgi:hypothetical protein